ncbi:MAG: hypothetical protein AAF227_11295, partial [Pseudomonadota bacterium]
MYEFLNDSDFPNTRRLTVVSSCATMLIVWFDVSIDASKTPTWLIFETGNAVISNRFLSGFFTLLATYGAVRTVLQYASRSYKKHSRTAEYEALAEKLKEWPRAAQD